MFKWPFGKSKANTVIAEASVVDEPLFPFDADGNYTFMDTTWLCGKCHSLAASNGSEITCECPGGFSGSPLIPVNSLEINYEEDEARLESIEDAAIHLLEVLSLRTADGPCFELANGAEDTDATIIRQAIWDLHFKVLGTGTAPTFEFIGTKH